MRNKTIKELAELSKKMSEKDYKQFLVLKGFLLGTLYEKKVHQ